MATIDKTTGGTAGVSANQAFHSGPYRVQKKVEFAKIKNAGAALTVADILQMIGVQKNERIMSLFIKTLTAAGQACTMDVGDGGSATRFATAHNLNVVGTETLYVTGYNYPAADTIDLSFNTNAPGDAVAHIEVVILQTETELGNIPSAA